MKTKLFLILMLICTSFNSFAHILNLDVVPHTEAEASNLIKRKTIELKIGIEDTKIYKSLFDDSSDTAFYARLGLGAGITGGMGAFFGAIGGTFALAQGSALMSGSATLYGSVIALVENNMNTSTGVILKYSMAYADLKSEREEIMEEYFDGSLLNNIKDHLLLGHVSKTGAKLLLVNHLKKIALLQRELNDLKSVSK